MGTDRLIYFRTDGNRQIASGHLMRCFSITLSCLALGMKVCFLVSDEDSQNLLQGIVNAHRLSSPHKDLFSIVCLKTAAFDHLEQELPEVLSLLASAEKKAPTADSIYFLDSYYVTENYLSALRPMIKIAYLDDLKLFDYPVDLLINYDLIPEAAMPAYKAAYQNACRLLLGAAYTPLRTQFQNAKTHVREQVSHILITTGGGDSCHFCLRFMHKWRKNVFSILPLAGQKLTFHVVIGKFNTDREALGQLAEQFPPLLLHENVSDMASLMQSCDLAISAAGTTLYELCALGVPAVSFTTADNQLPSAQAFAETGLIPCAGDMRINPEAVLVSAVNFVTSMSCDLNFTPQNSSKPAPCNSNRIDSQRNNFSLQKRISAHNLMCRSVDGKGAHRIACALKNL